MDRENNFDTLRLGAALSVILTHAFLIGENRIDIDPLMWLTRGQCPLGVAGVFVFFTISGYLVTQSAEATGGTLRFLVKRALRVYPGLAFCLLVLALGLGSFETSLGARAYFSAGETWRFLGENLALNIDWNTLPGVRFSAFPAGAVLDGPLWSLPCEVAMYLMVAALFAAGLIRPPMIAALFAIGIVADLEDTAAWGTTLGGALWLLPFFAAGMALYELGGRAVFNGRWALAALALLAIAVPAKLFIPAFALGGSYLVIWLAGSGRPLRAARYGDLSYGLYIYGWPAEQAVVRALGGAAPWWQVLALALPSAAAMAFLSWHLVEAQALKLKPRGARRPAAAPALT
jgi:peptidoglycan/LPS O-acetylase OafA/YrhL